MVSRGSVGETLGSGQNQTKLAVPVIGQIWKYAPGRCLLKKPPRKKIISICEFIVKSNPWPEPGHSSNQIDL